MSITMVNPQSLVIPDDSTEIPLLRAIDGTKVASIKRRYEAVGEWDLPPVTVDEAGLVIGGCQRVTSARELELTSIPAVMVSGKTKEEKLLLAIADNADHGARWSSKDEANLCVIADEWGIEREVVAEALRVPVIHVERKPLATVLVRKSAKKAATQRKQYVPVPLRPALKGKELTEKQAEVMASVASPLQVGAHLADLLRISYFQEEGFDALPAMTPDLYRLAQGTVAMLQGWIERDGHLLEVA